MESIYPMTTMNDISNGNSGMCIAQSWLTGQKANACYEKKACTKSEMCCSIIRVGDIAVIKCYSSATLLLIYSSIYLLALQHARIHNLNDVACILLIVVWI